LHGTVIDPDSTVGAIDDQAHGIILLGIAVLSVGIWKPKQKAIS
jgi:hypothetical protein